GAAGKNLSSSLSKLAAHGVIGKTRYSRGPRGKCLSHADRRTSRDVVASPLSQIHAARPAISDGTFDPRSGLVCGRTSAAYVFEKFSVRIRDENRPSARQNVVGRRKGPGVSSFDEGQRPSHGLRCGHQYDRGCEHQPQKTK